MIFHKKSELMIYLCLTHTGFDNVAYLKVMEVWPDKFSSHRGAVLFDFSLEASQSNVQEQFPVFDTSSERD